MSLDALIFSDQPVFCTSGFSFLFVWLHGVISAQVLNRGTIQTIQKPFVSSKKFLKEFAAKTNEPNCFVEPVHLCNLFRHVGGQLATFLPFSLDNLRNSRLQSKVFLVYLKAKIHPLIPTNSSSVSYYCILVYLCSCTAELFFICTFTACNIGQLSL